ncbi:hypothetical protein MUN84_07025 [Hymenobacter sp. 5516J-16]|uniref:Uncharacterized protein n=1 Tax=Hymenobacter sublimis TaxID=2933777 RepID=A0ABY4J658_9BACT|nr:MULTISPECIES: hypothetical protein [Hymenobacter]UOQ78324.1 hypothetical protein MUN84_07025 [Hymenobacter sp. 5516J-16]UPL48305.1 hypothetical protein MWH26_14040 [Hymenobacter sublimis]
MNDRPTPLAATTSSPESYNATTADFEAWLAELLPAVRTAIARHGFEKAKALPAFRVYLQERQPKYK